MSNNSIRNSLEKIDAFLRIKKRFLTITQISQDLNLHFTSVKKCLETLNKLGRVVIVSNGNTTLIRFKEGNNG